MADDLFVQRVKSQLVPVLHQQQFRGRFPDFTRRIGPLIQQISIRGSRNGSARSLTAGIGFDFLDDVSSFEGGIEYHMPFANETATDGWWRYNRESAVDCETKADNLIHCFHVSADGFFIRYSEFPGSFATLTLHDLQFAPPSFLPPRPFRNVARDCFVLMHLWHFLGNESRACEFAAAGMENSQNAVKLRAKFEAYLSSR
ncbi:MAG: hypothetical protein J0M26_21200 [Planctomycetes bacterium]|nr:hypothetical protein [Planctomycetota bacterium]